MLSSFKVQDLMDASLCKTLKGKQNKMSVTACGNCKSLHYATRRWAIYLAQKGERPLCRDCLKETKGVNLPWYASRKLNDKELGRLARWNEANGVKITKLNPTI